jgi:hypothetical protein
MNVSLPPDVFHHVCLVHDQVQALWHASGRERAALHEAATRHGVAYDALGRLELLDSAVAGVVRSKNRRLKPERLSVLKYLDRESLPHEDYCRWAVEHREAYPLHCQQFVLLNYCRLVLLTALESLTASTS